MAPNKTIYLIRRMGDVMISANKELNGILQDFDWVEGLRMSIVEMGGWLMQNFHLRVYILHHSGRLFYI